MFAMLVGMATYFMAVGFIIVEKAVITAALFAAARKHGMNAVWWGIAGFLLDFWALLFYLWVKHKIKNRKCSKCSAHIEENAKFCTWCGNASEAIDDGKSVKRFILSVIGVIAAVSVIGGIFSALVG